jgi:ankyrin repeat protein
VNPFLPKPQYIQRWQKQKQKTNLQYTKPVAKAKVSVSNPLPRKLQQAAKDICSIIAALVESLLNGNPRLANRRDDDDRLPLHWAVAYNRLPIISLLMQTKSFDVDAVDGSGWTPLMMAASLKDGDDMVDLLLKKSADVNIKNNNGQTALHFTASKNNIDVARKLVAAKATARVKDKRGQLALHRAAAIGSIPMLKILLEAKSPLNATDVDGNTALHHGTLPLYCYKSKLLRHYCSYC